MAAAAKAKEFEFDEAALGTRIADLSIVVVDLRELLQEAEACLEMLRKIEPPTENSLPIDPDTGAFMTNARRSEIFGAWDARAQAAVVRRPALPPREAYEKDVPQPRPDGEG